MSNRYSSRKFWTMVGSVALFSLLLIYGQIDQNIYQTLMLISVGGYLGANVTQHIKGKR